MTSNKPLLVNCPTCNKRIAWTEQNKYRPFCSERCCLIDLGEWASESHKIPGEPVNLQADAADDDCFH